MIIENIEQLKELAENTELSAYIQLNGGLKSNKDIYYDPIKGVWTVKSENTNDVKSNLTDKDLKKYTSIIDAIDNRALYKY